jgi:protein-S-isoprenylcysteine O-methyltransferase Ste14
MWLLMKNVFFAVLVPGAVALWLPLWIGGGMARVASLGLPEILALALVTGGLITILIAIFFFGTKGAGTPAVFDPPVHLVVRGPHRYVRNPMYASVVVTTIGWALFFRSWPLVLYAGIAWLFFHAFVMLVEEPGLRRRFGADYDAYCVAVRRWIPGTRSRR